MQTKYEQTINIEAESWRIFETLADIPNLHTILNVQGPAENYDHLALEIGYMWVFPQIHGCELCDIEYEVTALNPPSLMEWVGTSQYGTCTYLWRIKQITGASKVTLKVCSKLPESSTNVTCQAFLVNSKEWTWSNLQRLKEHAEGSTPPKI